MSIVVPDLARPFTNTCFARMDLGHLEKYDFRLLISCIINNLESLGWRKHLFFKVPFNWDGFDWLLG